MSNSKTLVLVDGSSYLYRAYHAMPDLRAIPGDPASPATGAIRGMVNMMQALRKDVQADYAVCVFDASGPTFRDEMYTEYKATRSPMPDDLRSQIEPIHEVVQLLGWKVVAVPGVEADDVIATLAQTAAAQGIQVIVSSGDKDLSQLVGEHVTIIDTMNGKKRDVAGVTAEFGVPPALMIDYQALVGDTVDNVPGVTKVGPKTAAKWLEEHGSLDNLIARAADIKGVAGQNLRDAIASGQLALSRQLVTMKTDCDLSSYISGLPQLDAITLAEPDSAALAPFYEKYGFKGLVRTLGAAAAEAKAAKTDSAQGGLFDADDAAATEVAVTAQQRDVLYTTILNEAQLDEWLAKISAAELTALDTETDSLDEMVARIVGISFSVAVGEAAYIPLRHEGMDVPEQLNMDMVLARLKPWLEDAGKKKLGQHVKYDQHVFANHGITVRGYAHDTMLQSYVLEADRPHNLTSLALRHVSRSGISYEDLCGKGKNQIPFAQVSVDKAAAYSCEDSDQTLDVHNTLWPRIQAHAGLLHIYELEMQTSEALFRIERNGVSIDAGELARQSNDLGARILKLEEEAYEIAGQPFNLSSPKQLGEIFFDKLGMPVVKKTATGARSTDEEVLEKLAEDYPLPAKLLEHRSLSKLKGTYTDKLAQMALPSDGRVHTHYAQAVAVTGRLSSNDPNLQNIPVRTPEGRRVREAFVAPEGKLIASADYSQIELRIMAHLSGDEALLSAFKNGLDVHRATAAEVFGVSVDEVSSEQRRYAKVINFGLIYGMSSFGLAKNLGIETKAAAAYIDKYFQRYPGVKRYMDQTVELAHAQGYVETVFGRRLVLPEINGGNGPRKKAAERAAINAPMQGTAADLIKKAMVAVQARLDAEKPEVLVIMQVHDELVFELPEAARDWVQAEIPSIMAGVADLSVPLLAEIGFGSSWEKAH
ncbi:DNA polymerase I [Comamonas thiooxydans]|uniref:DNA polymerase I n=1 Tax=Comamonas thiooxydans TaxID=363952 RepID=UPI0001BB0CAE|nr:DNA polymerase I [Comamonas thiooxydans]ACY31667.1 DNA polymerase I [Comamonas thiooxydans]MDO1472937.1 DNA polymerase I [Comamonas thiooxydans]